MGFEEWGFGFFFGGVLGAGLFVGFGVRFRVVLLRFGVFVGVFVGFFGGLQWGFGGVFRWVSVEILVGLGFRFAGGFVGLRLRRGPALVQSDDFSCFRPSKLVFL